MFVFFFFSCCCCSGQVPGIGKIPVWFTRQLYFPFWFCLALKLWNNIYFDKEGTKKKNMKLWWKVGNRGNCISVDCRWSELRSKMSVVSGVISRQVLPACGNLCFLCPSLRTRSRQPVKRYKKLIADIFPRSQVSFLNFIYICLYACIFWSYPFYNVYFKVVSQPDDGLF